MALYADNRKTIRVAVHVTDLRSMELLRACVDQEDYKDGKMAFYFPLSKHNNLKDIFGPENIVFNENQISTSEEALVQEIIRLRQMLDTLSRAVMTLSHVISEKEL